MSLRKNILQTVLNGANDEINEIIGRKTTVQENFIREKVVIPYCQKHGYSFSAGMGGWCFIDHTGNPFYPGESRHVRTDRPDGPEGDDDKWFIEPTEEDKDVAELLNFQFDSQNACIGAYMKDYRE